MTPYVLGGMQRAYTLDDETGRIASSSTRPGEVGADLKFGLTPSLTLDLTYNTDFAQVEVDEQRTNLTRFPLFFPEKRPFFLENAGIFSAGTPQAVELFFTRRIGIDSIGRPVPILAGGRMTGRVAGFTVGALEIVTEDVDDGQPTNSYTVARVSRELSARSRVGALAVAAHVDEQHSRLQRHICTRRSHWRAAELDVRLVGGEDRDAGAQRRRVRLQRSRRIHDRRLEQHAALRAGR